MQTNSPSSTSKLSYGLTKAAWNPYLVEGASHLFEEPGKLEEVAELAASWFKLHLDPLL